jgi:hypothetical protein
MRLNVSPPDQIKGFETTSQEIEVPAKNKPTKKRKTKWKAGWP